MFESSFTTHGLDTDADVGRGGAGASERFRLKGRAGGSSDCTTSGSSSDGGCVLEVVVLSDESGTDGVF